MISIKAPLSPDIIDGLNAGDRVYVSGVIYAARDAAHKRFIDLINEGHSLPFDINGQIIYYTGPAPAKPGAVIGSAGPTTSYRMDPFTVPLLEGGLKGMIGKGNRSAEVRDAVKEYKAVYFLAIGGLAALIAKTVRKSDIIAFPELGTEAVRRLEVEDFPVVAAIDCRGNTIFPLFNS